MENKSYANYLSRYVENNYFTSKIMVDLLNQAPTDIEKQAYKDSKKLYDSLVDNQLNTSDEAEIESDYITKMLEILKYSYKKGENFRIQGKAYELDFVLFANNEAKQDFLSMSKAQNKEERLNDLSKYLILEAKAPTEKLDNNKLNTTNPHYQLLNYLNELRCNWGILTNGRYWRLYDGSTRFSQKVFIQFNLYETLKNSEEYCFYLFYRIFNSNYFFSNKEEETIIHTKKLDKIKIEDLETRLANIIYGSPSNDYKDSTFENIGISLYNYYSKKESSVDLKDLFHNSTILLFRLVFLFYYESKFRMTLQRHRAYKDYSIYFWYKKRILADENRDGDFNLYGLLISHFNKLATGDINAEIPMLNGGLFDSNKALLLNDKNALDDSTVKDLFKSMLIGFYDSNNITDENFEYLKQDFSLIDIKKLGEIYENLLEYEFRIATEDTYLITHDDKNKNLQTGSFIDSLDLLALKQDSNDIKDYRPYPKGSIYLVSLSNNRKQTASYYTPEIFTKFMVAQAIESQVEQGKSIHKLSLIDNACGSGHFLVDALKEMSAQLFLELTNNEIYDPKYNDLILEIKQEKKKITENIKDLGIKEQEAIEELIDEEQILKRILLKRCIFGVDYNIIAVEIARLALWMETFIFATPLSFIEHHIKQGNSLIGATIEDYNNIIGKIKTQDLFYDTNADISKLEEAYEKIVNLTDTTVAEIKKSKEIYKSEVSPVLKTLNNRLNLVNYYNFINASKAKDTESLKNLEITFSETINKDKKDQELFYFDLSTILDGFNNNNKNFMKGFNLFVKTFLPFNIEIEFPDVKGGFDIIVGNPPWDEVASNDNDFFAQYNNKYRTMGIEQKTAIKNKYIKGVGYFFVKEHYKQYKSYTKTYNNYLKLRYNLNKGAGDSNLYKFFLEQNLRLLKKDTGVLNYLTPSVWSYAKGADVIRKHILQTHTLEYFYQFKNGQNNRSNLFKEVADSYKFANYQIGQKKATPSHQIKALFMQQNTSFLRKNPETKKYSFANKIALKLGLNDIKTLAADDYAITEFSSQQELNFIKKIYAKYRNTYPFKLDFCNDLHATNDNYLLLENSTPNSITVFEGKNIHQFNPNFTKTRYFANKADLEQSQKSKEIYRIKQQTNIKNINENVLENSINYRYKYYRLATRSIAKGINERTLIACILPKNSTSVNTINATVPFTYVYNNGTFCIQERYSTAQLFFYNAMFNSFVLDYIMRRNVDMNVNIFLLNKLPLPKLNTQEILANKAYETLVKNAVILSYINAPEHYTDAVKELNIDTTIVNNNKSSIKRLQAQLLIENDCIVANMYDITLNELELILDTFTIFNKKNPFHKETLLAEYKNYLNSVI